jgi:hypothetical protein
MKAARQSSHEDEGRLSIWNLNQSYDLPEHRLRRSAGQRTRECKCVAMPA